jgi:outer membrane protein
MGHNTNWEKIKMMLTFLPILSLLQGQLPAEAVEGIEDHFPAEAQAAAIMVGPSPTAEQTLTLDECVRIAMERNPLRRVARESTRIVAEEVGLARAPYYPRLNATAGYQRFDRHIFLPGGVSRMIDSNTLGGTDDWHAGISLVYTLYDSGRRRAELEAALARLAASQQETERVVRDLVLKVHEAYYRLLAGRQLEEARQQSLNRREVNLRLAEIRLQAGDVTDADVVRSRVEMANAQLALVRAQAETYTAQAELNAAMGLPILPPVEVEADGPPALLPAEIELPVVIGQAMARREVLEAARRQTIATGHQVNAARGIHGANLEATGSYGYRDEEFLPENKEWLAGLTLHIPLFTGFANRHQVARARAELARSEAELQNLELSVQQEVVTAYARLLEAYQAALTTENLVMEARESLRLTRARYEAGAVTINDLLDVEATLATAEADHVQTFFNYHQASSRFQRAAGELRVPADQ